MLFNAGIDSIAILANTNVADVEILLGNCAPFESAKAANGETERAAKDRKQLRSLWVTGQKGNFNSRFDVRFQFLPHLAPELFCCLV